MIVHTQHSQKRAAQRAISSEIISLTLNHGECLYLPGGVTRFYCPKTRIRKLQSDNYITASQAKKLKSAYLVVAKDGVLITTGYLTKSAKRASWKYTKNKNRHVSQ